MTEIATVIVGTKFYGAKALDAMDRMRVGDAVTLRRNEHPKDLNAVECHFLGVFIGYIPRITNPAIARAFDVGKTPIATVTECGRIAAGKVKAEPKIIVRWEE